MNKTIAKFTYACWVLIIVCVQSCERNKSKSNKAVTYCEHIEPIIKKHCTICHSKGGAAPFSLTTYQQVAKRIGAIAYVTESRYMPPWKPDPDYSSFEGERYLTSEEIELIKDWKLTGTVYSENSLSCQHSTATYNTQVPTQKSIVLVPAETITIAPDWNDYYCNYIFRNISDTPVSVSSINFKPSNASITHHAWLFIDTTGQFRKLNSSKNLLSIEKNEFHFSLRKPVVNDFLIYTPGMSESSFPSGVAVYIPPHSDVIVQVHYFSALNEPQTGQFKVDLFLSKEPAQKFIQRMMFTEEMLDRPLYIPANTKQTFILTSKPISKSMKVYRISPHMHYRGHSFKAYAFSAARDTIQLIKIDDWDLMWQGIYKYKKPILIPAGYTVQVVAQIDNTNNNIHNPVIPAVNSKFGYKAVDEMLEMMLEYTNTE